MPLPVVSAQAVPGASGVTLMARVENYAGQLMTQAALTSIAYGVYDVTAGEAVASGAFDVAATVFDTLQTGDAGWVKDSAYEPGTDGKWGYNFKAVLPASAIPVARTGHRFAVDVVFTPVAGEVFRIPFRFGTVQVYA